MTQYASWATYSGDARLWLAGGLLAGAGAAVLAGIRLPLPVRFTQPRPAGRAALIAAWGISTLTFLVCLVIYIQQVKQDIKASGLDVAVPKPVILPVTLTAAVILFVLIARGSPDSQSTVASAAIGTIAAPMIFELPFDPIVIPRVHTVLSDLPSFQTLVYIPLVLVEITTLLLLWLSPMVRLTRATFFSFALMLAVWAAWALTGFGYPFAPLPIALNIASKILAFVTGYTLFLPQRAALAPARQPEDSERSDPGGAPRSTNPAVS